MIIKFCTCHSSTTVMMCAKIHGDCREQNYGKINFPSKLNYERKWLVKRDPPSEAKNSIVLWSWLKRLFLLIFTTQMFSSANHFWYKRINKNSHNALTVERLHSNESLGGKKVWPQNFNFAKKPKSPRCRCKKPCYCCISFNTLRPRQNEQHFADDIFKHIFFKENVSISIKISLKFVPKGPINNFPALVQTMAWRRSGDKPLSEPMMVSLPTHICVTRPQWVHSLIVV